MLPKVCLNWKCPLEERDCIDQPSSEVNTQIKGTPDLCKRNVQIFVVEYTEACAHFFLKIIKIVASFQKVLFQKWFWLSPQTCTCT